MKKQVFAIFGVVILILSMSTSVFALTSTSKPVRSSVYGCGNRGMTGGNYGYGYMMDQNGKLLSKEAFEEKLDKSIKDGLIADDLKSYYLDMHDYCVSNGINRNNMYGRGRGGCGGRMRAY